MRVLFSGTPAHGHLLPLLPLARALRAAGHTIQFTTSAGMRPLLKQEGFGLLPAGPMPDVLLSEVLRRTGRDAAHDSTPDAAAELFAGVRVDLSADVALGAARDFQPELIVAELCDYVGPLVAGALNVQYATLAFGPALPASFSAALDAVARARYARRGLSLPAPAYWLDTCPDALQAADYRAPAARLALRPEAHQHPWAPRPASQQSERPRVLVSFGTHFSTPELLSPLLRALSDLDVELLVTLGLRAQPRAFHVDRRRVQLAPFTPLDQLLDGVSLVVMHGGAGTTLGSLARGVPLVVIPQGADQFLQAERVAAVGAGLSIAPARAQPGAVAAAVETVLVHPGYRARARSIAAQIARMPPTAAVADQLQQLQHGRARVRPSTRAASPLPRAAG